MYLMITHFPNHWDKIKRTKYPKHYIHPDVVTNPASSSTLFVKIDQSSKKIEHVWKGKIDRIEGDEKNISFDVIIDHEIKDFDSLEIEVKQPYWRYDVPRNDVIDPKIPPFFDTLNTTKEWNYFENETYTLLKLMGINTVFKFINQRGEADGYFRFETLAVIYDTTLEDDFETKKKQQIENFCAQLQTGKIAIDSHNTTQIFHECHKQVWIITRGSSRIIRKYNDIVVKEISVKDLMKLYRDRLDPNFSQDMLEKALRLIGE